MKNDEATGQMKQMGAVEQVATPRGETFAEFTRRTLAALRCRKVTEIEYISACENGATVIDRLERELTAANAERDRARGETHQLRTQAGAWEAVWNAICRAKPKCLNSTDNGMTIAVKAIEEFKSRAERAESLVSAAPPEGMVMPDEPTLEMLWVIVHGDYPADWERGKEAQRRLGLKVIPPKTELEMAYGQYQRLRELIARDAAVAARPGAAPLREALAELVPYRVFPGSADTPPAEVLAEIHKAETELSAQHEAMLWRTLKSMYGEAAAVKAVIAHVEGLAARALLEDGTC